MSSFRATNAKASTIDLSRAMARAEAAEAPLAALVQAAVGLRVGCTDPGRSVVDEARWWALLDAALADTSAAAEAYTARVRRAALEEAAGVCDAFAAEGGEAPHRHVADEAADEIAGRLRTMAREVKP